MGIDREPGLGGGSAREWRVGGLSGVIGESAGAMGSSIGGMSPRGGLGL